MAHQETEQVLFVFLWVYHQNPNDNIGFGDLVVKSDPGLAISSVSVTD